MTIGVESLAYTHIIKGRRQTGVAHDGDGEDGPTAASTGRTCAAALQGAAVTAVTKRTDYLIWSATVPVTHAGHVKLMTQ